ncbi:hypothetical protein R1flu_015222 [Riccia fluitans]|uniref:Uncharacterized protein n=1 Tax=Riccia fluitans TaxID=41844 RepID=A0ABD1YIB9_9MARC
MVHAPSSSSTAAAAAVVVTDPSPSVSTTASQVATLASAMGVINVSSVSTTCGSSSTSSSARSDVSISAADQELPTETLSRSLSASKLNAKAPEFVPKGIISPTTSVAGFIPGLIPVNMLSQTSPGVLPHYQPLISPSQFDQMPVMVGGLPPVVPPGTPPPHAQESGDALHVQDPFPPPPQTILSAVPSKPVVTEELKAKIVKQVEFYFSDQNLPTDNYLMKFVKKDPDGFVPIPVVASFRKIKNLVKNNGIVAAALRNSTMLVVSEDGKKVRRAQPLPDIDLEEVQSRTVVAENLPEDHSVESIEQLFASVGSVKMVRICQPEAANGANQTAAKFKTDMVVSNKLHALIEFETVEQAEKAVSALTDERNWRSGLRVRLLLRRTFQSKHGYQQAPFQKARKPSADEDDVVIDDEDVGAHDKSGEESGAAFDRSEESVDGTHAHDGGAVDRDGNGKRGRGRGRGGRGGRGRGQHTGVNGSRNQLGSSPQSSIFLSSEVVGRPPPGPRMPDGTRGFSIGRGKIPIMGPA